MTALQLGVILALALLASAGALVLTWRRLDGVASGRRAALMALRGLTVACLAVGIASPVARRQVTVESPPRFVVLVDRSASMGLKDAPGGVTRYEWAAGLVTPGAAVGRLVVETHGHCYTFADEVVEARLPLQAAATGPATDIDAALRAAMGADPAGPPDAVVVLTDGAANRGPDPEAIAAWLAHTRVPVFCLGVGRTQRPPDVWLTRVEAPRAKAGSACTVTAVLGSRGLGGRTARIALGGKGLPPQTHEVSLASAERQRVSFTVRADKPGLYRGRVWVAGVPGEWTRSNNERTFFLRVTPGETKLLVVAGHPGTELKFISRALDTLADVRVKYLVRKAGQGFAGLAGPAGTRQLPVGRELNAYEAVMLQDVPASAFTSGELSGLAAFVSERGGGLAVLGGPSSFRGECAATPLGPALGVRLQPDAAYSTVPVKAARAAGAGGVPPVADIERHDDFPGWPPMPLLGGMNPVAGLRPGASAPLRTETGEPLMVVQRYGLGRTLCLLSGGTDRWVLSRDATEVSRKGHAAFWRVLAEWLTTPPNRAPVALETDRDVYGASETARVAVQVTDAGFQPVSSARVVITARSPDGQSRQTALPETAGSPGHYEGGVALTSAGTWKLTAAATSRGVALGSDSREVAAEAAEVELANPAQGVAFLRSLADASGGAYLAPEQVSQLPAMVKLVPHRTPVWVYVAWARGAWALGLLVAMLGLDWFLRRWWGVG